MSKSSRRLRIRYWVHPPDDSNLWWSAPLKKWVTQEEGNTDGNGYASHRCFRTKRRALAHANTMGKGFVVTQLTPHCGWRRKLGRGTWLIREWEII